MSTDATSPPVSPPPAGAATATDSEAKTKTDSEAETKTVVPSTVDFSHAPFAAWLFFVAEVFCLVTAVAILITCAVLLLIRLGWGKDGVPTTEAPPMPPETYTRDLGPTSPQRNEFNQLNWYSTVDSSRQRARTEQRLAIYQSAAVSAGVAVGFIALMLFLRTGRLWATVAAEKLGFWERVAHTAPGILALVCATVIIVAAREDRSAQDPKTPSLGGPGYSFGPPQAY
jgi:hypothetical protein